MFEDVDLATASPAELLTHVVDADLSTLDAYDAVTYLQMHERVVAWLASRHFTALIAAASPDRLVEEFTLLNPRPGHDEERMIRIEDAVREEIAAALRLSTSTAQDRIDTARLLAGPLSPAREALNVGEITTGHVAVVVEAVSRFAGKYAEGGPERESFITACGELQRRVLPIARRGTLSATRAACRRAVLAIDADGERQRRQRARCTRDVYVIDELDGISTLIARMATADAHAILSAVDAKAHEKTRGSRARIGELRAEALADLVIGGGGTAHVDVVIGLDALLGLTEDPADLRGSGPVAADIVRELLADESIAVTMRRLVADPVTGHLLDVGRKAYEVPDRLRQYIATRDGTCRFPGCARNAHRSQIDHALAWDDGGGTDAANLGALCIRHHQLKTHAGWEITQSKPDGSCTWRSPQGRTYEHPPEPLP